MVPVAKDGVKDSNCGGAWDGKRGERRESFNAGNHCTTAPRSQPLVLGRDFSLLHYSKEPRRQGRLGRSMM